MEKVWCDGCGLYLIHKIIEDEFVSRGWTRKNTVIVSGIGCTGRISGYFEFDGVHTTHGRAIPVAQGIKIANPSLNVVVISGDGDLLGIGVSHLIHAARRDTQIHVFCNHNKTYGMTGGQLAPTTPLGAITKTTQDGNLIQPINVHSMLQGNNRYFYASTAIIDSAHMRNAVKKSLDHEGFSFVEIYSICHTNYGRLQGEPSPATMLVKMKADPPKLIIDYK